ncbi:MAG: hypothetical protein IPM51_03710 [Sphingobacteriaceae bacterium]|nr:hypothetical protein [Sphingobacteriaceae bacterium]
MDLLRKFIQSFFLKPTLYLFIFIAFFSADRFNRWANFDKGNFPLVDDVDQYYSYLPAFFIHDDLSFSFEHQYWTKKLSNGNHIPKVTLGMALMYSPFFISGHLMAKNSKYKADGYSLPYKISLHIGSILFSIFGLWFCRKNLLRFFNEYITLIVLIAVYFGTNLFYYTYGFGEMPHAYLFFLFSLFIYFTFKWWDNKKLKYLLALAFTGGFATLIRPNECLLLFFPLLLHVNNLKQVKERFQLFSAYRAKLLIAVILFLLPFFVQMLYWKTYTGQWFYFSYGEDESFFFSNPKIFDFLFSFRKGWFIYTPLMFLAIIGIFMLKQKSTGLKYFLIFYLLITIYILSSWWDWAYGGSFGSRAMIQYYSFLVFPLAAFFQFMNEIFKEKILKYIARIIIIVSLVFMIDLNLDQSWLYKYGIIASDGMTKEAYLLTFGKEEFSKEEVEEIERSLKNPDREAMKRGERD